MKKKVHPNLVSIKNLEFGFLIKSFLKKERPLVIKNASFDVGAGEFVSLVGSSGSGKSTIGSMVARLLTGFKGEIYFNGKKITNLNSNERKSFHKSLQVVFQDPEDTFDPSMTMRKNIEECYFAMGSTKIEIDAVLNRMLPILSLEDRLISDCSKQTY